MANPTSGMASGADGIDTYTAQGLVAFRPDRPRSWAFHPRDGGAIRAEWTEAGTLISSGPPGGSCGPSGGGSCRR
jgi:hypothetical protein